MTATKRRTITRRTRKNYASSSRSNLQKFQQEITAKFLYMLNTIKLYHWKTRSYATHKATDELYSKLGENMDKFIEVLLGKTEVRTNLIKKKSIPLKDVRSHDEFKREVQGYKKYLVDLNDSAGMQTMTNTDLYNIRDEILADLNQFLYLFTFK
jgi:DNA-binding ferritin-like protein